MSAQSKSGAASSCRRDVQEPRDCSGRICCSSKAPQLGWRSCSSAICRRGAVAGLKWLQLAAAGCSWVLQLGAAAGCCSWAEGASVLAAGQKAMQLGRWLGWSQSGCACATSGGGHNMLQIDTFHCACVWFRCTAGDAAVIWQIGQCVSTSRVRDVVLFKPSPLWLRADFS